MDNDCPAGLEAPAGLEIGEKLYVKIRRNPQLRILPLFKFFINEAIMFIVWSVRITALQRKKYDRLYLSKYEIN